MKVHSKQLISPKAIIYDWDNTLIDSWGTILTSVNATFEHYGKPLWTLEDMKQKSHRSARDMMPEVFGEDWEGAYDFFYQHVEANHCKTLRVLPYANDIIDFFHNHNIPQYVLSNKKGHILRREITHLKWNHYFENIVGSGDFHHDKPDPRIVPFTLNGAPKNGMDPSVGPGENIWFVGDTPVDWACAKQSGCFSIGVTDNIYNDQEIPDILYASLDVFYDACRDVF